MKKMKFSTYAVLLKHQCFDAEMLERIEAWPKPSKFCGHRVPDDLNELTMGQVAEMLQLTDDTVNDVARIILDPYAVEPTSEPERTEFRRHLAKRRAWWGKSIANAMASDAVGFFNWVQRETERIAKLFDECAVPPTADELRAGADKLSFGIFGTIDWYAQRMGITNHDDVLSVPWVVVYQCTKNDNMKVAYERRLNEIMTNKTKTK